MIYFFKLILILSSIILVSFNCEEQNAASEENWVYESRLWHYHEDDLRASGDENSYSLEDDLLAVGIDRQSYQQEGEAIPAFNPPNLSLFKPNSRLLSADCNQYRLDTQDAIVCTEERCDKLKFEWPIYNNQITIVQTTKHGMRFHQVHYAFSKSIIKKFEKTKRIDIFDLFKPKPTPTLAPTPKPTRNPSTTTRPPSSTISSTIPSTSIIQPSVNSATSTMNDDNLVSTIRINPQLHYQTIEGFGGALSDSTCLNMRSLSSKLSKSIVEDYYGDDGLRYTFARMSIGSSDFSTTPYTNNDVVYSRDGNDNDDVDMMNFRLTKEDYEYKIPMARLVNSFARGRKVKFLASMWSPPVWMKNNSHIVHGFLKGDVYGPYYHGLSELTIKFLEAYKKQGIDFWGLTVLNEPVTGVKPFIFHNSLGLSLEDYVTYIKIHLGPMLERRGFGGVKLLILDDNKGYAPKWVRAVLDDPDAAKFVDGIAIHWYMNDEYENLNFIPRTYPGKFILSTEACSGHLPFQTHALPGNWARGVSYMMDIVKMMHKSSIGWIDWNMALDLYGGPSWAKNNLDSAIIVDLKRNEYYKSPMYYAMGHFSRFIEPGSIRLGQILTNVRYDYPLDSVSFLTPQGYIVIVCYNNNRYVVPLNIVLGDKFIRRLTLLQESFNTIIFKAR